MTPSDTPTGVSESLLSRLNIEQIRRWKKPAERVTVADGAVRGLYLVVEPSGLKRFVLRYKADGKTRRYALGRFGESDGLLSLDAARALASEWREKMRRGTYPHEALDRDRELVKLERDTRRAAPTLSDAAELFRRKYLERHTRRPEHRLISFNRWIVPELGHVKLADIRRRHLNAALDKVAEAGHGVAAYGLARLLGQMFRFAVDEELIESTPAERLRKGTSHTPGDRVLSDDEVREVWAAMDQDIAMSQPLCLAVRILLLTGARAGELCSAEWADIQLDDEPVWNIPRTSTKTGQAHSIPLSKGAVAQLRKLHDLTGGNKYVLPGKLSGHVEAHALSTALRRCHEAEAFGKMTSFGAHDLRRTMRTGLARLGIPAELAERVIGHKPRNALIATYDHYDRIAERREALSKWDREVNRILSASKRKQA